MGSPPRSPAARTRRLRQRGSAVRGCWRGPGRARPMLRLLRATTCSRPPRTVAARARPSGEDPLAEQAAGAQLDNKYEENHDRDVADLGEPAVRADVEVDVILNKADEHGGDRRAGDRAESADHDDDEGEDQQRVTFARGYEVA